MRVYARPGWRMAKQLGADAFVLLWIAGWGLAAWGLHRAVNMLAVPAQESAESARRLGETMQQAQGRLQEVPMVGDRVGEPFGQLSGGLMEVVEQANRQVDQIHQLAWIVALISFAVPVLGLIAVWAPRRWRFVRQAAAARTFINADADLDLFALRAMANLPMHQIAKVSDDPVTAWRSGDAEVIRRLAALELERTGLAMPRPVRPGGSSAVERQVS